MRVNNSVLDPYIIYNGSETEMRCQVTDDVVPLAYENVTVKFYSNVSGYLGENSTNVSGWAFFRFVENNVGNYLITCNVSSNLGSN